MEPKNRVFELEKVTYSYLQESPVLKDVDLVINQGEKVVILGANGSGKSTLQKILNGLIYPQTGTIKAFGQPLTEDNLSDEGFSQEFRRRVGFIFQNSDAQLFSATVWDEIAFGPLQMNLPAEEVKKRVESIIEMLGLGPLKERPPYKLSGGEKKKVAIAAVLSINPEVLILDEPTNGLDPRTQRWLVNLLVELNQAGKTIITATHNLEIIQEIGDRAIVFSEDHQVIAEGSPEEILHNKDLLMKVNLIDDHFHEHNDGRHGHLHLHAH